MNRETARALTSHLNGAAVTLEDPVVLSTINELAGIISGRAVTRLTTMGYKIVISPPSLVEEEDTGISDGVRRIIVASLDTEFGSIMLKIAVRSGSEESLMSIGVKEPKHRVETR